MGIFSKIGWILRGSLLVASPLMTGGVVSAQSVEPQGPVTHWQIAEAVNDETAHLVHVTTGGSLHAICSHRQCDMFVEPAAGCLPGQVYPLLTNSAAQVDVLPARCLIVRDGDESKLVAHIASAEILVAAMLSARDLSIAFPTQDGQMDVLDVRMQGAAGLLRDALGSLPEQAATERKPDERAALEAIVRDSVSRYQI
ncbi:MAG: hypothetical protein R3E87_17165 [Burkholderiaceae bacterium]